MAAEKLVGTWELVSFEHHCPDGKVLHPYGEHFRGILMYSADGYMSSQVALVNRPRFVACHRLKGTGEEVRFAYEGYWAYSGTYTVNEKDRIVYHNSEMSLYPNEEEIPKKRFFAFSGDLMTLSSETMIVNGQKVVGILTWKRIK